MIGAKPAPLIDRAIAAVAPGWALRRAQSRAAMVEFSARGAYDGAARNRMTADFEPPTGSSADADLLGELRTLRDRSRHLVRNDAIAASILRTVVDNVVGGGIRPQAWIDHEQLGMAPEAAAEWQRTAEKLFRRWVPFADTCMRTDFYGLQGTVVRKVIEDGEVFALPVMVEEPNRPFETSVDLVEADRVDTPTDGVEPNQRVRSGVVLGRRGQPVAYYVQVSHPGDARFPGHQRRFRKIPTWDTATGRRNVHHVYQLLRPAQTRGQPMLAPVIPELRDLAKYGESERVAARVNACFAGFRKREPVGMWGGPRAADGTRIDYLQPGIIQDLAPGEDIVFANPARPTTNFASYTEHLVRRIGASLGLPLELILCDFSKTNYSSARAALLEARRFFRRMQMLVIERFCQPVWEAVIEEAVLKGELEAQDFLEQRDLWCRARWIPPGFGWVDPRAEIDASSMAIESNLSTLADECAAQGLDWEEVLVQRAREEEFKDEVMPKKAPPALPGVAVDEDGEPLPPDEQPVSVTPDGEPVEDAEEDEE